LVRFSEKIQSAKASGAKAQYANGWAKSATVALSSDSYDGAQALNVQSGWISREIPVNQLSESIRFSGFFKGVSDSSTAFVGIDFVDANGQKVWRCYESIEGRIDR